MENFRVTGPKGQLVPLSTFATIKTTAQPRQLNRFQQLNSIKLQAALFPPFPDVTLDKALKVLEAEAAKLPKGYVIDYAGSPPASCAWRAASSCRSCSCRCC